MCRKFSWRLQGNDFYADVLLIPLGSCDMVLGVQWLSTLGTIQWSFQTLHMEFYFNNKRHVLGGLQGPKVKIIEESQLPQAMQKLAIYVCYSLCQVMMGSVN